MKSDLIRKLFWISALFVAVITVISAWEGVLDPDKWWFFSITGLVFPMFFILNLVMMLTGFLINKRLAIVPLAAFLLTVVKSTAFFQLNTSTKKPDYIEGQSVEIKFLSFNVRLFDLYNWSHNYETREKIFNFLSQTDAGIVCFQEFYSSDRDNMNNEEALKGILNMKYRHIEYPVNKYTTDHYGIATYTSFPIVNRGVLYLDKYSTNICIYSDLKVDNDTIRIYNCHLQSVRFGTEDYKFLEEIGKSGQDTETIRRTRTILGRLKRAFIKRAGQAEQIALHIAQSPHPVIICGDFNDTALSYCYKTISKNLLDAFIESGNGLGRTYAGPIPGLRIDYILYSDKLTSYGYKTHRVKLSDHYPIEATFVINP